MAALFVLIVIIILYCFMKSLKERENESPVDQPVAPTSEQAPDVTP